MYSLLKREIRIVFFFFNFTTLFFFFLNWQILFISYHLKHEVLEEYTFKILKLSVDFVNFILIKIVENLSKLNQEVKLNEIHCNYSVTEESR